MKLKLVTAIAAAALLTLGMTGCAGGPQSKSEACSALNSKAGELQKLGPSSLSDSSKVEENFAKLESALKDAKAGISNKEVSDATNEMLTQVSAAKPLLAKAVKGDAAAVSQLTPIVPKLQSAATKLATLCPANK